MSAKKFQPLPSEYFAKPVIPYIGGQLLDGSAAGQDRLGALLHASMVILQVEELVDLPDGLAPFRQPPLSHVRVFIHLDLIRGLARDEAGLRYLAGLERIDGIVTVHHHLVPAARRFGLQSTVRLFIQDGRSVKRSLAVVEKSQPNAIELLPGIAAVEVASDFDRLPIPRFAGGLIRNTTILDMILASGHRGVSTSNEKLWLENARR